MRFFKDSYAFYCGKVLIDSQALCKEKKASRSWQVMENFFRYNL